MRDFIYSFVVISTKTSTAMASVKVAVRARPFNKRETDMHSGEIIKMQGNKTTITNLKVLQSGASEELGRERVKEFTFDYSYWSVDSRDPHFVGQEQVFKDLGQEVVDNAFEGYNACIFAYGQTGSGKTFTMMGSPDNEGLIPRICQELYARMRSNQNSGTTFRTEVSYLEIYNEKVKDLLKRESTIHNLRVREHPKLGPYVQDLSRHLVTDYSDVQELMARGNAHRTTACTAMNDVSSRSHAIFTLNFTQATLNRDMPSETVSKVNLVDLAGSERADSTKATGQRLKEGGHINKSLVTLGTVISALAELSTSQSRKTVFIPYRDSVLTWLLKDSLGGNSKTIMIATISPAECNYGETLSTLRYANRAKNIINKPTINEDPNVKLIKELREEIARLKCRLGGDDGSTSVMEKLQENEARVKFLTDEWTEKWKETHKILKEQKTLGLRMSGQGVVLDSERPHLIGLGDGLLSTGVVLYHLKDGRTLIGTDAAGVKQDIVLNGAGILGEHCAIELTDGCATLIPKPNSECYVDTAPVDKPTRLTQGCLVLLGSNNVFRYNDPAEADKLKKEQRTNTSLSHLSFLSRSVSDIVKTAEHFGTNGFDSDCIHEDVAEKLEERRRELEELENKHKEADLRRRREQEAVEKELAEKREQLQQLQRETETLREMAEEAHKRAEEEQMKLAKITDELQRHLQEQANQERGSAAKIMEMQQELNYLTSKEKEVQENTERLKRRLEQERVYALSKLETEQSRLCNEIKSLEMQEADLKDRIAAHERELSEIESDLSKKKGGWTSQRKLLEEEIQLLKEDLAVSLGQASENWRSLLSLVPTVRPNLPLPKCSSELSRAIESIREQLAEAKQTQLAALHSERQNILGQIAALEEKRRILQSMEGSSNDECEAETKARLTFLEEELRELREEEAELSGKEEEAEEGWKHNLDSLDSLLPLVDSMVGDLDQLESCIKEKEQEMLDVDHVVQQNNSAMNKIVNEGKDLEEQLQHVQQRKDDAAGHQAALKTSLNGVDEKIVLLAMQEEEILGVLHEKKERLQAEISRMDHGKGSPSSSRLDFDDCSPQSEPCTFLCSEDLGIMTSSPIRSPVALYPEKFHQQMREMHSLEKQFEDVEKQLDEQRTAFETECQEELGMIELQRLHLQKLEEQRRIMALINEKEKKMRFNSMTHSITSLNNPINGGRQVLSSRSLPILPTWPHFGIELGTPECPIKISIPSYTLRGSGRGSHIEYEVKIAVMEDAWTIFRRYKRFRELHQYMKHMYGKKVMLPYFPPKKLFGNTSERLVEERRKLLEVYLIELVNACRRDLSCPLHRSVQGLCKQHMWEFAPFFRKGCFETSKHSTG